MCALVLSYFRCNSAAIPLIVTVTVTSPVSPQLGKSVVAKVALPKGTVLTLDVLAVKVAEPMGVAAEDIFQLVGKAVTQDVEEDESLVPEVVDSYGKKVKC